MATRTLRRSQRLVVRNRWLALERDLALVYTGNRLLVSLREMARSRDCGWPLEAGLALPLRLEEVLEATTSEAEKQTGVAMDTIALPPAMFSPPGSGADAVRERQDSSTGTGGA